MPSVKKNVSSLDGETVEFTPITCEGFYALEDEAAEAGDVTETEEASLDTIETLRKAVAGYPEAQTEAERNELRVRICIGVAALRRATRLSHFRNRIIRESVAQERQNVDEQYLQLQNLIHEVQHLQKEVMRCLEFKSAHEELALVPVEEFYAKAPPAISKRDATESDPHQLRLARLTWELEQRKMLSEELQRLEKQKEDLANVLEKKRDQLQGLKPKLDSILAASRPLQNMMNMKYEEEAEQTEMSHFLPAPLFYLYLQIRAYREILEKKISLTVEGNLEEAKKKREQEELKSGTETPDEDSGNEEEEEERRSGKPRKRRPTVSEAVDKHRLDLLELHPLVVLIRVPCKEQAVVELSFCYASHLELVTVKTKLERISEVPRLVASATSLTSEEQLLQRLFHTDDGLSCPNPTGLRKLDHFGLRMMDHVSSVGYPFHWAQKLAGLKFPNEGEDGDSGDRVEGCDFLQRVLFKIRRRVFARFSLQHQMASLEQLRIIGEVAKLNSCKIVSRLTSWKSLTLDDFKCHPATQQLMSVADVPADGWYFSACIERGDAKLMALIRIGSMYPEEAPLFVLLLKWKGTRTASDWEALRALEESVNVECWRSVGSKPIVLSAQLQLLRTRLDILLETESARVPSQEFPREHLFSRKSRGPSRDLPFLYEADTNSFHHA